MIKFLTRVSLLALFSTTIFAAAAIAPPPASADWVGEIAPGAEQPAGQAQESRFADANGRIFIPTPTQAGETAEVTFLGSGTVSIAVSDGTNLTTEETPPLGRIRLSIRTDRTSTSTTHGISFTTLDRTAEGREQLLTVFWAHFPEGGSASVEMTGSFVCSGTICDGPQDGKLSFSLEILAPPE